MNRLTTVILTMIIMIKLKYKMNSKTSLPLCICSQDDHTPDPLNPKLGAKHKGIRIFKISQLFPTFNQA